MERTKKEIIKNALVQLFEEGNSGIVNSVFTQDYVAHADNKEHKGQEFIHRFSNILKTSIPDISVLKIDFLIEDEETISWQRTFRGTHKKNMMGIPASNKSIKWNEMVTSRFVGGKIAEEWVVSELMGQLLLHQKSIK